ncbi:MAG: TolC family protein [Deltaproteobacteria bacterium]|jgi:outer membrane protein TolC|nr:TolC family protein [Deltaproteobacteria bacterium]MCL5880062.1 TolC family protein [Deltaproteobacteria bacterium]MDA8304503.1 TolC family protein [Deltaproteobacteria bacterium]
MKDKPKNKKYRIALSLALIITLYSVYLMIPGGKAFAFKAVAGIENQRSSRVLTLKEAYILAARRNGTIKANKESYYQSTLLKWSAFSMLLPNIDLTYKDQRMHSNVQSSPSSGGTGNIFAFLYPDYEYSFTLDQPLLKLGALPAYGAAENTVAQAKMNLNNVSAATLYNVAASYYTVLNDISLINADTKTYNEAKSHLELTEAKLKAGLAIITDVLQAKSQFYAAKQELISAKNSLKSAKANLAAILGISRRFKVIKPAEPVIKKALLKKYIFLAYKNNPGLRSLRYAQKAANNETQYYETQYIPQINFQASYSALSNNHFIPGGSINYWTAGAVLTMPLFQGGTRIISIEKARSAANQAMYNMVQSKRNLKAQVVSDFYNIQNLKYEVTALEHEEKFASKNYMLVEEEYKAGVATSVDVVTALAQLTAARHNLLAANLSYYKSVLNLKRLIGSFKRKLISLTVDKFN